VPKYRIQVVDNFTGECVIEAATAEDAVLYAEGFSEQDVRAQFREVRAEFVFECVEENVDAPPDFTVEED
jgi:hypothetical protein